jgi:choline kinase
MNRPKIACILAAGRGTRLGATGKEIPKGFLRLGEPPIIEESLQKLRDNGIERTVIVTGHLSEQYQEWASAHADMVTLVHNPKFADSGSLYSMWCARAELNQPFLLLESDLVYETRALSICREDPRDSLVLVSGYTKAGDEVYVETDGDQLVGLSKKLEELGEQILGEFVGICKVSPDLARSMMRYAEREFEKSLHLDYETDGLVACAAGQDLPCRLIPDLVWAEIDMAEHLERARNYVYPRIGR